MRNYKREWEMEKRRRARELPRRAARARARRLFDRKGINRKGKDIDHKKALSHGGTNALSNLRLQTPSQNRSFSRHSDGRLKRND